MAFPGDWQRRVAITIDPAQVAGSGTLSNFPALLTTANLPTEMVDAGSNSAQDGGGDIRFSSDSAGSTQLACEVVDFHPDATAGNRRAEIWVKVASLSGSSSRGPPLCRDSEYAEVYYATTRKCFSTEARRIF